MAVAIAAVEQDVYPPRVQVTVTGLTTTHQLDVYRSVGGQRTLVRGGHVDSLTDTAFIVTDAELPFAVPVTYIAVVDDTTETATTPASHTLPGGKAVISDAISAQAVECQVTADGGHQFTRDSVRMRIGDTSRGSVTGRNVTVTGPAGQSEGSYEVFTATTVAHQQLLTLLATATEATVQLRQPGTSLLSGDPYEQFDAYLTVDQWTWRRFSQDGSDPRRLTTIQYAECDGWSPGLEARGVTYQELVDFYAGGTYADLVGDFATYLALAQAEFS